MSEERDRQIAAAVEIARGILERHLNEPPQPRPLCTVCGEPATYVEAEVQYLNGRPDVVIPYDYRCDAHKSVPPQDR